MVRSGRSAGLTPTPCAAACPGLASEETAAAAEAPRNPRRELVFDIVTSRYLPRAYHTSRLAIFTRYTGFTRSASSIS